jgi:competence protein ComEA
VSRSERIVIAGAGAAVILAIAAGVALLAPAMTGGAATPSEAIVLATPAASGEDGGVAHSVTGEIVVDVEGGVMQPGIQRLPFGARVADAIAAAGGYSPQADLTAAAEQLNLAQPLSDGEQVLVPLAGASTGGGGSDGAAGGDGGGAADGGLVNLNTATPEELDALPGIGPVTVQKIVAAREEQPFSSLDEAVERGVLNRGQLDKIRDLATAS